MRQNTAMIASLARGVVVCGGAIILMPLVFGPGSLWYSMLVTEIIVMAYSIYHMLKSAKSLT